MILSHFFFFVYPDTNINQTNYRKFLVSLLNLFSEEKQFLENRGSLIIRQLCVLLNAEFIYRTFAEIILEETRNIRFASTMVQTLHTILISSSELFELRQMLKDIRNEVSLINLRYFSVKINRNLSFSFDFLYIII